MKKIKIKSYCKINLFLKVLNKKIQARYVWQYVLKLDSTEQKLKDTISKKLILGITKKL